MGKEAVFYTAKKFMKKFGLTTRIMIGLALGVVFGMILSPFAANPFVKDVVIDSVLAFFGGMFINLMKVMIVPLVSISLGSSFHWRCKET